MISPALLERVACPVCLEPAGCPACARPAAGHAMCSDAYAARAGCACGGPDKVRLRAEAGRLVCPCCATSYPLHGEEGYADLVPRTELGATTHYADHDFQERLSVSDAPPLLSARVKADMMLGMLRPEPGDTVLDLGCGAGKLALYAGQDGVRAAGVDVAPFFLPRAAAGVDLALADLRRLPFRKGAYPRAFTIDVLEHLDEPDLRSVLLEARRTLGPAGRLFVYTHAMESSRLARFQRAVNRLARRFGQAGLLDHEREAMRKTDHRNPVRSHEHFEALCAEAGLEVTARRYYNVVFKAVVEDLLLRIWQHRPPRATPAAGADAGGAPAPPRRHGRIARAAGYVFTWLLKWDVVLFGGVRTGPFFALVRPRPRPAAETPRDR